LDGDHYKFKTFTIFTTTFVATTTIDKGLHATELKTERVVTQLAFEEFILVELHVPLSRLEYAEGFPFEFELGRRMVHELGSSIEGSGDTITQTNTPKFMEEVAAKVMKTDKAIKLFQTMAIVNMNMGNLTMEVNTLKNKLVIREKEKPMLHEELDNEREFQKDYKHTMEI
jgi:hypothetical protein